MEHERVEGMRWEVNALTNIPIPKRKNGEYYVYLILDEDGELVYIGSGKGDRYLHAASGKSHNYELNAMHFKGVDMFATFFIEGISKEDSMRFEAELIAFYNPVANSKGKTFPGKRWESYRDRSLALDTKRTENQETIGNWHLWNAQ